MSHPTLPESPSLLAWKFKVSWRQRLAGVPDTSKCTSPDIPVVDVTCWDMPGHPSLWSQVPNRILEAVYLRMQNLQSLGDGSL